MWTLLALSLIPPASEPFQVKEARVKVARNYRVRYLLSLPEGYATSKQAYPLLIFLHGAGERGNDLERVKVNGPPRYLKEGQKYPFIVVSPQCPDGEIWNVDALSGMLSDLEKKHRVDRDRIYLTGLSMGGYGTWEWAGLEPKRFAAIMPICGGGSRMWSLNLAGLPIWCAHGDADTVVPISESRSMIERAQRAGARIRFTIYEGVGHGSWVPFYSSGEWVDWLLNHSLKDREKPLPGEYQEERIKPAG